MEITLGLGIVIGILLTMCTYLFSQRNPNFFSKVEKTIDKKTAYIAGSESDGERFPENEEVRVKKYGLNILEKLDTKRKEKIHIKTTEYQDLIDLYKKKIKDSGFKL